MCVAAMMGMLDGGSGDMVDASVGRHNLLKVRQVPPPTASARPRRSTTGTMTRTMTVATRCGGADSDRPSGVTTSLGSWGQRLTVVTGGACREEEESTKEQDYGIMFIFKRSLG